MKLFPQRIGIWYTDKEVKDKVFNILLNKYRDDENLKSIQSNGFYFKTNDFIVFAPANENSIGTRFTDSFLLDDEINKEIIDKIIWPCTILGGKNLYVLDTKDTDSILRSILFRKRYKL